MDPRLPREKQAAPICVPLRVGAGIAGATAIGTLALMAWNENLRELSKQLNQELVILEDFISRQEKQVESLAEVVLQNQRGLNLFLMKEGRFHVTLGGTCCFYVNLFGIVREELAKVREDLRKREERGIGQVIGVSLCLPGLYGIN